MGAFVAKKQNSGVRERTAGAGRVFFFLAFFLHDAERLDCHQRNSQLDKQKKKKNDIGCQAENHHHQRNG
jgi:hypothetical protein